MLFSNAADKYQSCFNARPRKNFSLRYTDSQHRELRSKMRHRPSINYYYYTSEQGGHANSETNVMWAINEPWPTTTNLPVSLSISMLGQRWHSVISIHEYTLTFVWIRMIKSCKKIMTFPNTFTILPWFRLSLFGQTTRNWHSVWLAYLNCLCKLNWFSS